MDLAAIIAKVTGAVLLVVTLRSVYRHFITKKAVSATAGGAEKTSISESILNNLLLYLWLAFMLAFSTGMIVNN